MQHCQVPLEETQGKCTPFSFFPFMTTSAAVAASYQTETEASIIR